MTPQQVAEASETIKTLRQALFFRKQLGTMPDRPLMFWINPQYVEDYEGPRPDLEIEIDGTEVATRIVDVFCDALREKLVSLGVELDEELTAESSAE